MVMIPIELFLGFIGITLVLVGIGLARQIPAMMVFAGMFLLMWTMIITEIDMGSIPVQAVDSGATTTYNYEPDIFEFTEWPKVIFALFSVILMLIGALMTRMGVNG